MLRVWGSQSGPPSLSPVPCDPTGTEPSPVFQPAGGSGRVLPFPRMRISFLPLSGDPGVSTQPWGTGRGSLAGNWGAETPGTALGVPPLPFSLAGTPRMKEMDFGGVGTQDGDTQPFPPLLPFFFPPRERCGDFGGEEKEFWLSQKRCSRSWAGLAAVTRFISLQAGLSQGSDDVPREIPLGIPPGGGSGGDSAALVTPGVPGSICPLIPGLAARCQGQVCSRYRGSLGRRR